MLFFSERFDDDILCAMAQQDVLKAPVERRCPNCGTRVAVEAESCFMCGYDLRIPLRRQRKVSIIDILLVVAVFVVLVFWWQLGRTQLTESIQDASQAILPGDLPELTATATEVATPIPASTSAPSQTQSQVIQQNHVVQPGETLLAIANQYQVTVEEIQAANNLSNELIRPDQRLIIPKTIQVPVNSTTGAGTTSGELTYTVMEKDTIFSIAGKFGSTADEILATNNLAKTDIIRPGQLLRIPIRQAPAEVFDANTITNTASNSVSSQQVDAPTQGEPSTHPAPNLTGPGIDASIFLTESVVLRWVSVDLLSANEWYVVQILPAAGSAKVLNTVWTKSTSHRIDVSLAPAPGDSATYKWQITIVRVNSGNQLEAVSPPSEQRQFTWQ